MGQVTGERYGSLRNIPHRTLVRITLRVSGMTKTLFMPPGDEK
jgi:hypothetical protein